MSNSPRPENMTRLEFLSSMQREAWQRGDRVLVEALLRQHPNELLNDEELLQLVVGEFQLRREWGDSPAEGGYAARFPALKDRLLPLLAKVRASDSPGTSEVDFPATSSPAQSFEVGSIVLTYRLVQQLGDGATGTTWKARHITLDKDVVLKVLPERLTQNKQLLERFERETQAVSKLDHPHIVRALDAGEWQGRRYLVMEYAEGFKLSKLVADGKARSVADVCEVIRQAATGLQHAHEHGLVHRDVNPDNLIVTKQGKVKVLDLGVALLKGDMPGKKELETITESGQIPGSPDYMAPEQWEGSHTVDARADVYALGCTLFFLLTGRAPYSDSQHQSLLSKMQGHIGEAIPDLKAMRADVPDSIHNLFQSLMAKNPSHRLPTAGLLAKELATIRKELLEPSRAAVATPAMTPQVAVTAPSPPPPAEPQATEPNSVLAAFADDGNSREPPKKSHTPPDANTPEAIDDIAGLAAAFQSPSQKNSHAAKRGPLSQKPKLMWIGAAAVCLGIVGAIFAFKNPSSAKLKPTKTSVAKQEAEKKESSKKNTAKKVTSASASKKSKDAQPAAALPLPELVQRVDRGIVRIDTFNASNQPLGHGTGFVIDDSGLVATNFHVVDLAAKATATFEEGKTVEIKGLRAWDQDGDLAILELAEVDRFIEVLPLNKEVRRERAIDVVAIGHPQGFKFVITPGIISAIHRTDQLPEEYRQELRAPDDYTWLQIDAAINSGNSGGPLMNRQGEVIGIITWVVKGAQNLNFAIDVRHLRQLYTQRQPTAVALSEVTGPFGDLVSLVKEFENNMQILMDGARRSKSRDEAIAFIQQNHPAVEVLPRINALAERFRQGHVALPAWSVMCRMVDASCPVTCDETFRLAADRICQTHRDDERIMNSLLSLRHSRLPSAQALLKRLSQESQQDKIKAWALYALAGSLREASPGKPPAESIEVLEQMKRDYGHLQHNGYMISDICESEIFTAKFLSIGCTAQDIVGQDQDAQEFKLSDFRGKVVVLDFWADWCPHCVAMYPLERILVEKHAKRPFALLGINADKADRFRQVIDSKQVTWRNWCDGPGGPISEAWHVSSYPTLYVLDHNGVIRYRDVRGAELEAAVEKLLAELPASK